MHGRPSSKYYPTPCRLPHRRRPLQQLALSPTEARPASEATRAIGTFFDDDSSPADYIPRWRPASNGARVVADTTTDSSEYRVQHSYKSAASCLGNSSSTEITEITMAQDVNLDMEDVIRLLDSRSILDEARPNSVAVPHSRGILGGRRIAVERSEIPSSASPRGTISNTADGHLSWPRIYDTEEELPRRYHSRRTEEKDKDGDEILWRRMPAVKKPNTSRTLKSAWNRSAMQYIENESPQERFTSYKGVEDSSDLTMSHLIRIATRLVCPRAFPGTITGRKPPRLLRPSPRLTMQSGSTAK